MGREVILSDFDLGEFRVEKPCLPHASRDEGPQAAASWLYENDTPPLDAVPTMPKSAWVLLKGAFDLIRPGNITFPRTLEGVGKAADDFVSEAGCEYEAARAYVYWRRRTRNPTTLTPDGQKVFGGKVDTALYGYSRRMATLAVKPFGDRAPVRFTQAAYSNINGHADDTAVALWVGAF